MSEEEITQKVDEVINKYIPNLDLTLEEAFENRNRVSVYVGLTKRQLHEEDLRFLTERGAHLPEGQTYKGRRNRPVLVKKDGNTIKMKEARNEFGFQSTIIFSTEHKFDAAMVEAEIQRRFQGKPLGWKKLWRCPGKGPKRHDCRVNANIYYHVYITWSFEVVDALESGKIKVQN